MRLGLTFADRIVDPMVVDEFEQAFTTIATTWNREHDADGGHLAMSAVTLDITGKISAGTGTISPQGPFFTRGYEFAYDSYRTANWDLGISSQLTQYPATTGGPQGIEAYMRAAQPSGTVTLSIGQISIYEHATPGTTTEARGFQASMFVQRDADGTATSMVGYLADMQGRQSSGTGTGTVTTATGIRIEHGSTGITNRWGVYQTSASAANYFNGSMLLKRTAGILSAALAVSGHAAFYDATAPQIDLLWDDTASSEDGFSLRASNSLDRLLLYKTAAGTATALWGWTGGGHHIIVETSTGVPSLSADTQAAVYVKSNNFVIAWNDGGTARYKYLDLTGTGVTWTHSTTEP